MSETEVVHEALDQAAAFIDSREKQLRMMLRRREALTPEATKAFADGLAEAASIVRQRRRDWKP